jgi:hypothetical protein
LDEDMTMRAHALALTEEVDERIARSDRISGEARVAS